MKVCCESRKPIDEMSAIERLGCNHDHCTGAVEIKRIIYYSYRTFDVGCGCCSDSSSTYDLFEDGKLVGDDLWCPVMENEEQLREYLAHLEPFDVDSDSQWF